MSIFHMHITSLLHEWNILHCKCQKCKTTSKQRISMHKACSLCYLYAYTIHLIVAHFIDFERKNYDTGNMLLKQTGFVNRNSTKFGKKIIAYVYNTMASNSTTYKIRRKKVMGKDQNLSTNCLPWENIKCHYKLKTRLLWCIKILEVWIIVLSC